MVSEQLVSEARAGLILGLILGLLDPRSVLITSRNPQEERSRSVIAALVWGLVLGLGMALVLGLIWGLGVGLSMGLGWGVAAGLKKGGWFVLLQTVAHRRLARAGNLPSPPYDFLEWGIEQQIFRRVGVEFAFGTISSSST